MSETVRDDIVESQGLQLGSWAGAALGAFGLAECVAIVTLGGTGIMDEGGFVASGGPYEIAHPTPQGFWILPVAFMGILVFSVVYGVFASRIKGFGLAYPTWCALWSVIGATTLWYGFNPPFGEGLVWGWLTMGSTFLLVGLGSAWLYVGWLRSPDRERWEMAQSRRVPYSVMVAAALAGGAVAGSQVFSAVTG